MSNHLLTVQERQRFVRYCREEAESYRLLLTQVEKLGPQVAKIMGPMHQRLTEAYMIVADHLEEVEQ